MYNTKLMNLAEIEVPSLAQEEVPVSEDELAGLPDGFEVSVPRAARYLGVVKQRVRQHIEAKRLKARQLDPGVPGSPWVIRVGELRRLKARLRPAHRPPVAAVKDSDFEALPDAFEVGASQAGRYLGVSRQRVRVMIRDGKLKARQDLKRPSKPWLIRMSVLRQHKARATEPPSEPPTNHTPSPRKSRSPAAA